MVPYCYDPVTKTVRFLVVTRANGTVEVMGGKTDAKDASIWQTIMREVKEESNNVISVSVSLPPTWIYFADSKFFMFFLPMTMEEQSRYKPSCFGAREIGDAERQISWLLADEIYRLRMIKYDPRAFFIYCNVLANHLTRRHSSEIRLGFRTSKLATTVFR